MYEADISIAGGREYNVAATPPPPPPHRPLLQEATQVPTATDIVEFYVPLCCFMNNMDEEKMVDSVYTRSLF
jgi:hypothetical protein